VTSQIDTTHTASTTVTPLFVTSRAGGAQETMVFLDPSRPFSRDSLHRRLVGLLASKAGSDTAKGAPARLVVVGTSDFASDRYARNSPENVVFVENAIDWLAQDEALIGIRSKNRAPPRSCSRAPSRAASSSTGTHRGAGAADRSRRAPAVAASPDKASAVSSARHHRRMSAQHLKLIAGVSSSCCSCGAQRAAVARLRLGGRFAGAPALTQADVDTISSSAERTRSSSASSQLRRGA